MRGSPLLRALIAFLAILLLGFPLWRLTRFEAPADAAVPMAPAAAPEVSEIPLQLTFSIPPARVAIFSLGKEVWSDRSGKSELAPKLQIAFPKEGVDLQFKAEFSEAAPHVALRVVLTDPASDAHERTLWGDGGIDEVVTFP